MFYIIHVIDNNDWIWIKKKKEAVLAAQLLFKRHDITLHSSDGFGNYESVPFGDGVQVSIFDPDFDDVFEKYIFHDGYSDFYAYRLKK